MNASKKATETIKKKTRTAAMSLMLAKAFHGKPVLRKYRYTKWMQVRQK